MQVAVDALGEGAADADGQGGVVAADGDAALNHVAVEGTTEGIAQPGEAGELLVDVSWIHTPILKQKILDSQRGIVYNKEKLMIEEETMATTVRPRTPAAIEDPAYQAFLTLRVGFVVAPILFGLDSSPTC